MKNTVQALPTLVLKWRAVTLGLFLGLTLCTSALAGPREQAKQMHDRLTGVPPSEAVLLQMADEIENNNDPIAAAYIAMDHEAFYSATLKRMAAPWTNRDLDPFVPLNDYIATFIGLVRDEADYRRILYDDVIYTVNGVTPAYSNSNNNHYEQAEADGVSLRDNLQQQTQSAVTGLPSSATAGVMTTRAGARAFFYAGTNRAMLRFTMMSQMCMDLEQVQDNTGVPDRIRQDVSRSPGGDSRLFMAGCVECHTGMDPLAQAFAYYDYVDPDSDLDTDDGSLEYNTTPQPNPELGQDTRVQPKYHINATTFPYGYVTLDDRWDNYWREGPNAVLGWNYGGGSPDGFGNGAKSMGRELANSRVFAQCQVEKVFRTVCLREPEDTNDQSEILTITDNFVANNYNLKQVFAETAEHCMGP